MKHIASLALIILVLASSWPFRPADAICSGTIVTGSPDVDTVINKRVGWPYLYSYQTGSSIVLSSVFAIWPSSLGNLVKVTRDSQTIWTGTTAPPAAMLSFLIGTVADKSLYHNTAGKLWLYFQPSETILVGSSTTSGTTVASTSVGRPRAFKFTAAATGTGNVFYLYADSSNTATSVIVGVYTNSAGNPGTRLSTRTFTTIVNGAWNRIDIPSTSITQNSQYWLAILSPTGGIALKYRKGTGAVSEDNNVGSLTTLPATWSPRSPTTNGGPISAYLASAPQPNPSEFSFRAAFECGSYAGYPALPTCSIVGPDTVCGAVSSWHNASVTNEDPRYSYTYLWSVDGSDYGSGKNMQIPWASYGGGSRSLSVRQYEKYGSMTTFSNGSASDISKSVYVVLKPTPVINFDP